MEVFLSPGKRDSRTSRMMLLFNLDSSLFIFLTHSLTVAFITECYKVVSYTFPYLFPSATENQIVHRFVASINWIQFAYFKEFAAAGLNITPLPGKNIILVGVRRHNFVNS
jgi:hypothetical protein